jgi:hypothetical protein
LRSAKLATIGFAVLQILVGISGLGGGSVVNQVLAIQSLTLGIILGLFVLAMGSKRTAQSSLIGIVGGVLATITIVFVLPHIKTAPQEPIRIGWPWYGLITCTTTCLCGKLAQLLGR